MMKNRQPSFLSRMILVRPVAVAAVLFAAGIATGAHARVASWVYLVCALPLLIGTLAARARGSAKTAAFLLAAVLFLGAWRVCAALETRPALETQYGVLISGTIASPPEIDPEKERLTCRLTDVSIDENPLGYDVRLYLRGDMDGLQGIRFGERVFALGHFFTSDPPTNPGQFDFGLYLWRNGMAGYATAQLADAELEPAEPSLAGVLYAFRASVAQRIDELFPQSAVLVRALVLGDRSEMDDELRQSFSQAGVAHLLAISGLHVTILGMGVSLLLGRFLSRRLAFLCTGALVVFYGALAGFSPSIVRAILMLMVLNYAPLAGRNSDPYTRLGGAFLAMLAINPLYVYDAGFVLSFSAVAGLLCLSPFLQRCFSPLWTSLCADDRARPIQLFGRLLKAVSQTICATLAAQLGTLPFLAGYYGTIPLLGTLTNLLAVPLAMLSLPLSMLSLLLSCAHIPLGVLVARVPDFLLHLLTAVTRYGASLPLSQFRLTRFPGLLIAVYLVVLLAISDLTRLKAWSRALLTALLPGIAALAAGLGILSTCGLSILFFDAGQADCALVIAQQHAFMVDVGSWDTPAADYLLREGLQLDAIFLSHPHADHAGGLVSVLQASPPKTLYLPSGWFDVEADEGVAESVELARSMGVEIVELSRGAKLDLSRDVEAEVLHPPIGHETSDPNAISMVLQIRYGEGSALFTGDLPSSDEPADLPRTDVLKVAHHGSSNASSIWQMDATAPSLAVIQVGRANRYGHPSPETLERLKNAGASVVRTDLSGALRVRIFPDGNAVVHAPMGTLHRGVNPEKTTPAEASQ